MQVNDKRKIDPASPGRSVLTNVEPTIPTGNLYSWESQERQFPKKGKPGLHYECHTYLGRKIDCLLYRNNKGHLIGILYHYGQGMIFEGEQIEKPGNVNIWIRPNRQRRGIGTALFREATKRWSINPGQQRYTPEGLAFARKMYDEPLRAESST